MAEKQRGWLSFGVFVIVLAISLLVFFPDWGSIFALILTLYGLWGIVLAEIRAKNPQKYERGTFSTLVWAILFIAIGSAWFVSIQIGSFYAIVLLLIVIGILVVTSAILIPRKK
jgi:hypothetical protein